MLVQAECIPCYFQQALNTLDKGEVDKGLYTGLLKNLLPIIENLPDDKTPAENSTVLIHELVRLTGGADPFLKAKRDSNQRAEAYMNKLSRLVDESEDLLFSCLKISVAGNVVDLGIFEDFDLTQAIDEAMKVDFAKDSSDEFKALLAQAKHIFIIGDNSGEIVFDRLLVKHLLSLGKRVTYGVKGGFILNDATMEDAKEAGLTELCPVISNGNSYLGTIEEYCSQEFLRECADADIIISKGQANYESLEGTKLAGNKTFFLLKAKCPIVASHLGVKYGDIVFAKNQST